MTIERALIGTTDAAAAASVYVEDVFSTYLYTGTGASQTINNGIDLATKGGLVWTKNRAADNHALITTTLGGGNYLFSNTNDLLSSLGAASDAITSFNSNGYTLGTDGGLSLLNVSPNNYVSWTFRKAAKFFDIVTYTGTGSARTISHNLGATPGMIIVKRTSSNDDWYVYHKGLTSASYYTLLDTTAAQASAATVWNSTAPTSSVFSVGTNAGVNASGGTYIAYLFADSNSGGFGPAGTDSVVACGSFTTDASGAATVSLGWEPQWILTKASSTTSNWLQYDIMRLWSNTGGSYLTVNSSAAESASDASTTRYPTATGFVRSGLTANATYIYLAIRRPMKTPTDATKVFAPVASNASTNPLTVTTGFPVDTCLPHIRSGGWNYVCDRLRGGSTSSAVLLHTESTDAEAIYSTGFGIGFDNNTAILDKTLVAGDTSAKIYFNFKRAPGFFDVVCATAAGSTFTVTHNLGVAPEMVIWKNRNVGGDWNVYHSATGNTKALFLNYNWVPDTDTRYWNATSPTASVFTVGSVLASSGTYVAYLFATCPGVSKVGSYTGTGSAQNINCGFAAGARFVLIKRTDSTGAWYTYDSARGINASGSNDPYLLLNSTAAEVTNTDYLGTYSSGFALTSSAPADLNASGGSYIFLAIA